MKIQFDRNRITAACDSLLSLSRSMRTSRRELEEICMKLRRQTELRKNLVDLDEQEQAVEILTARLVTLSATLREISVLYDRTEDQNAQALEGQKRENKRIGQLRVRNIGGEFAARINKLLYR